MFNYVDIDEKWLYMLLEYFNIVQSQIVWILLNWIVRVCFVQTYGETYIRCLLGESWVYNRLQGAH